MPACSQWEMWLLRTMWLPMVSLFQPFFRAPLDGPDIAFGGISRLVVPLVAVFAERDARTARVADHIVFDDPAFAPMGADQADLFGRGRSPGSGRMAHGEAAHGDIVDARSFPDRTPSAGH